MDFGGCYPYVTSMASLTRKPRSKFWFACFRDAGGKQRRKSTQETNYKKAMKIAEQYEQVAQRKLTVRAVRETMLCGGLAESEKARSRRADVGLLREGS
jgi:hypothetical protein